MILTCDECGCVSNELPYRSYFNVTLSKDNISEIIGTENIDNIWNIENREDFNICGGCFPKWVSKIWDKIIVVYRVIDPVEVGE